MDSEFSWLRILGFLFSVFCFVLFLRRLRSYQNQRGFDWLLALTGLCIGVVSVWPNFLTVPTEVLRLDSIHGGRIITLLLIVCTVSWIFILRLRTRSLKLTQLVSSLIHRHAVDQVDITQYNTEHDKNILVLIPAYNEANNLPHVLSKIPKTINGYSIITVVIDDCSDDNTASVATKWGALVLKHPVNCGGGMALRTGYLFAKSIRPHIVVTMDADGQHQPEEISILVEPLFTSDADIVIGSRRLGSHTQTPLQRKLGIYFFSGLISRLIHNKITDCSSGFRAIRFNIITALLLRQEQYHTAELIIEAGKRGFKIIEKPINIKPRISGKSKKGNDLIYGLSFFSSIIRVWLR